MVAADAHCGAEDLHRPRPRSCFIELLDGRGLGDGDVVKHTQRANDEARQKQARDGDVRQVELNEQVVLIAETTQLRRRNREVGQACRQHHRGERPRQRGS